MAKKPPKKKPGQARQTVDAPQSTKPIAPERPPEEVQRDDGRIEHPRVRRESSDVRFRWVLAFVVVSILVGAGQLVLVWQVFEAGLQYVERENASRYPLAKRGISLPRDPRLEQLNRTQGLESGNVRQLESVDLAKLGQFGSTSDEGYVHIPIDDAMDLVVKRLPVRKQNADDDYRSRGLVGGGESNSGRMFRGKVE